MKICKIISFRLWHQLTLKLTEFVKNEYFAQNGGLVEVIVKKTYSCEKCCEQKVFCFSGKLRELCYTCIKHLCNPLTLFAIK